MTSHILSSHNMSAESIRDILCLVLRFMRGLLLARVFRRKWSLLVSCKQTHAAFAFTRIESLLLCLCFSLLPYLVIPSREGICEYKWIHTDSRLRLSSVQHSLQEPGVFLYLVHCLHVVHHCQGTGNLCQWCWWYNKWQEWVLQYECCS